MEKAITKYNQDQLSRVFGRKDTGLEKTQSNILFPRKVNIYSTDKQDKFFTSPEEVSKKDYGKLFVSPNKDQQITNDDLMSYLDATLIYEAWGAKIFEVDIKNQMVEGGKQSVQYGFLPSKYSRPDKYEAWKADNPGMDYKNTVRVILTQKRTQAEVKNTIAEGGNPFIMLELTGTNLTGWFDVLKLKDEVIAEAQDYFDFDGRKITNADEVMAPAFKFRISSKTMKHEKGDYYVFDFKMEANPLDVLIDLEPICTEFKDKYPIFGPKVDDVVATTKEAVHVESPSEHTERVMLENKPDEKLRIEDKIDDLPF